MKGQIYILTSTAPHRSGGVERFVREITERFEIQGYVTHVFHGENSLPGSLRNSRNRIVRQFSDTALGYYVGKAAAKQLTNEVVAILSNGVVGWYPFRISGHSTKRIHFYHGTYCGVAEAIRPFITARGYLFLKWWVAMVLEKWSGRGKILLCNSDQSKLEVLARFGRKCHTIWLPLDTNRFSPKEMVTCRRAFKLPENKPVGLFVGSLQPHKGFPLVRALLDFFPNVHWVLLIRGDQPADLASHQNVTLLPEVSDDELPLLYGSADFSLCPSSYEPFGYVVAEALACGTTAISSPTGASRLFLNEPPLDRFLVSRADDIDGFRRAVSQVLLAPERYRRIVLQRVRPRLEAIMAPENWWLRFSAMTGL
jgi:glycosyltransferase involved in cell wall biosynthesis